MTSYTLATNQKEQSGFTLIEVMPGLFIVSWVFVGAFSLLLASMKGVQENRSFDQLERIHREHMYGRLASDFDRSTFAFHLGGVLEIDNEPFRASGNFIPELVKRKELVQDQKFFSILKEGFRKKGKTLVLNKDQGESLLFLGPQNTVNAYYEMNAEADLVKRFERKEESQVLVASGILDVKSNETNAFFKKNSLSKQLEVRLPGDRIGARFFKTRLEGKVLTLERDPF